MEKNGMMTICKINGCTQLVSAKGYCKKHYLAEYYSSHKEQILKRISDKYHNNPEKFKSYLKKYQTLYPERKKASEDAWRNSHPNAYKQYVATHLIAIYAKNNRYVMSKINALPKWFGGFDRFVFEEAAILRNMRELSTGIKWNIDHIVPLRSKIVCGLHISNNIQVIPAYTNQAKSNRFWPDMPEGG